MKTDLEGKVVLVTGASGGIGSATARAFADEGARLVLHYRSNRPAVDVLARELGSENSWVSRADLTKEPEVERLFTQAVERYGQIDVLVANAGAWEVRDVPLPQMSLDQWRTTVDSVMTSVFLCAREFFRLVARQRQGNAVLIGSTAAVFGEAGHADYAAAKAGVTFGITRTLKNEIARLAPTRSDYGGGRVNAVCPGWTEVPRTAPKLRDPDTLRGIAATMALPKVAQPEDIANAIVFLASDRLAGHISGQVLVVAGGMEGRWLSCPDEGAIAS